MARTTPGRKTRSLTFSIPLDEDVKTWAKRAGISVNAAYAALTRRGLDVEHYSTAVEYKRDGSTERHTTTRG